MPIEQPSAKNIFWEALELESDNDRESFVRKACGSDDELRTRVEKLLAAQLRSDSFLASPVVSLERTLLAPDSPQVPGTEIGPYKIREQLGEGGMGVVYVAEQTEPVRRKVALKIIKPGMDSKEVIARFEAERQALAMMSHPNIAKILDGGTTDTGRPYFVMELVKGIPITEYCDQQRLDMRQRLELFATVCQAVQHAHQKGIIHRDLKPSNVLVELHDVAPVPKVIDFGIAKAVNQQLTQQTVYTQFAQLVGTPLYMSPEQAQLSGMDVDTRSDVYSLGVMLYELLTGITPFDESTLSSVGLDEMRRIIREDEPARPSHKVSTLANEQLSTISQSRKTDPRQLSLSMRQELDWIVMRALEKDRTRRYESPSALSQDIQRYLEDEPVEACPPSVGYRLQKYATRHKGLLTTISLLAATLLIATGVSVAYAVQADNARDDANEEKNKAIASQENSDMHLTAALDAVDKLLLHASNPELRDIPQVQSLRLNMLEDVLAFYDKFKVTNGESQAVRLHAAITWQSLGKLGSDLGKHDLARKGMDEAQTILEELVKQYPEDWPTQYQYLNHSVVYGSIQLYELRDTEAAQKYFERQEARAKQLQRDSVFDDSPKITHRLFQFRVGAHMALATIASKSGDQETFQKLILESYEMIDGDFDLLINSEAVHLLRGMAVVLQQSEPTRADQYFRKALDRSRQLMREEPSRNYRAWHADLLRIAETYFKQSEPEFAAEIQREAIELSNGLATDFPNIPYFQHRREIDLNQKIGELLKEERIQEAVKLMEELPLPETADEFWRVGTLYDRAGKFERADQAYEQAIQLHLAQESLDDDFHSRMRRLAIAGPGMKSRAALAAKWAEQAAERLGDNADTLVTLSIVSRSQNQFEQALVYLNRAILLEPENYDAYFQRGAVLTSLNQHSEAIAEFSKFLELNPTGVWGWFERGKLQMNHFHRYEEALADLNKAVEINSAPSFDVYFRAARAEAHLALNQFNEARDDLQILSESGDKSYTTLYQTALLALKTDRSNQYRTLCQRMLVEFTDSQQTIETHFVAWTAALAPDALKDYAPAITLAEQAAAAEPENQQFQNGVGAILMRSGRYDDAKTALAKALAMPSSENTFTSYIQYFLAMTEQHLGNADSASKALQAANKQADSELAESPAWNRSLTLELLRKEAEALIGTSLVRNEPPKESTPDLPPPPPLTEPKS